MSSLYEQARISKNAHRVLRWPRGHSALADFISSGLGNLDAHIFTKRLVNYSGKKKRKRAPASERTPPSVKFDSRQSIKILLQKVGTRLHGGAAYTSNWRVQAALANGNLRGFRRIKFESSTEGPSLSTCVSLYVSLGKTPFALLAQREIKLSRLCDVVSRTAMVAQDLVGPKTANMYS